MKIGHSLAFSETFLPKFIQTYTEDGNESVIYADIAGLNDSGGYLIEFINCFVTKELFKRTKHIRFIVAITCNQV